MIIINKNSVKVNNNSIEIPLEEVLNQVYMLMDVNDMDISDYISNEEFFEELQDLNETIKIDLK